ncbi:MAG TPA: VacJ family lipoprotein [Steroidobacteraceae bacterium]|nr:VacJ family lipoprotein [Steroidobacteraceae bacterium]
MIDRLRPAALSCALLALAPLGGCATTGASSAQHTRDPFENVNRGIYKFNDVVDRAALKPVAKGYKKITPEWFRRGVGNFFSNLQYPATIFNQLLQGKGSMAARDTARLLTNTLLGFGGVLDPASRVGLDKNDEDLGQTLGVWGVPSGPYIVLPFLGPSTIRDAPSTFAEFFVDPLTYADVKWEVLWGARALDIVDVRAQLLALDPVIARSYDPYAFVRNSWLQRREYQVRDGDVAEEDLEEGLEPEGELPEEASPAEEEQPPQDEPPSDQPPQ